ncbi:MAG: energy transducer TonB [Cytophagales bacterium]|nr:energy transducer TonB [Cytophagales bacterium]
MENKKNEDKRVERKIPLFYTVGLNISIFLTIVAFEWKTVEGPMIDLGSLTNSEMYIDETIVLPPDAPKPEPPKPKPVIVVKEVDVEPEDVPEEIFDTDVPDVIPDIIFVPIPPEKVDEIFDIVEEQPSFPGGFEAFYKFVGSKMKYPSQARRMGIEGRVYLQFVVEKDGSIGDLFVAKGIGAGLDKESLRVMNLVPKFNPGKQRGKPVRVRMTIPINFKLQ